MTSAVEHCSLRAATMSYRRHVPASDLQWIALHRENATAKACEMVESMRKKGDTEGADTWLRIIAAITTLGEPPTDARH